MRAEEVPGTSALKLPVYVPSARWIVSPGAAAVSADLSWAAVLTSTTVAAPAVVAEAKVSAPVVRAVASRAGNSVRVRMGVPSRERFRTFSYMNVGRVSELAAQ